MLTLNDGRAELWQWDTGRTLAVDTDCSQVHFSNKVFGRSIDVDVTDGVAIIPDVLLQTDKDLNVWAFVGTAENGYTKISKTFKVNRRNRPADYVFTPTEQTTIAELVERLDKIEESQDQDAIKNAVEDYLEKNPVEIPVQSVNGQTGVVELTAEDVGAIADETDPTVPDWAKQPTKPSYTAEEVGALPISTVIPTVPDNVSAFRNDAGYLTEHQDISGKLDASELPTAINTALAQAKASGEFDGADGKSAYQYAQEGGYTGTETAFAEKLAQEQLDGTTYELTPTQVYQAVSAGIPVKVQYTDSTYGLISFTAFAVAESLNVIASNMIAYYNGVYMLCELFGDKSSNAWGFNITTLAQKTDIPTALPNPNALTIKIGGTTVTYDGSAAKTVTIADGSEVAY